MFCFQLCVLHCLTHEGRAPHIYCRGTNVDKLVQPQLPSCPVPPESPLPPPISPAPPLPPASPVPPASSLPPVFPLIPALPLALVSLLVLYPLPNGAAHIGTTQHTVPHPCERLAGINQQELLLWRGHSCQPHVEGLQLLRSNVISIS